jgi:uncharacterized repeat protein (TIGR01451 family)
MRRNATLRSLFSPRPLKRALHIALASATLGLSATAISGFVAPQIASADPAVGPGIASLTAPGVFPSGVVPDGTCSAVVTATGGTGASSGLSTATGGAGGRGSQIKATFGVVAGQPYSGVIGGGGLSSAAGAAGGAGGGGAGGTVGGGHRGGGGAGATSLVIAGQTLLVAGGGGGGGAVHVAPPAGTGGNAGVLSAPGIAPGTDGTAGVDNPATIVVGGGKGGGVASGGAGGINNAASGGAAASGAAGGGIGSGTGGNGGPDTSYDSSGGGGAGYTGGGGGASTTADGVGGSGGGGGSSFLAATSPNLAGTPVANVSGTSIPAVAPAAAATTGPNGSLTIDWIPCLYDLGITKTVSASEVQRGATVVWTVTITNNGPDAMTKGDTIDLTDTLPVGPNGPATPGFKILSIDPTAGSTNSLYASGPITCTSGGGAVGVGSAMPATPATLNCGRPFAALAGTPGNPNGGLRGLNNGESITITYEQQLSTTATCPATITNSASVKDRATVSGTTDVVGVIATNTATAPLKISCEPKLKLVKALNGARIGAADQFTVAISPNGSAPSGSSATTAGTGSTVTANTGVVAVASATAGQAYNFNEAMAAGSTSALSQYGQSVTCVNAKVGATTVLPAAGSAVVPFAITPGPADDITCTLTNKPLSSSLSILKKTVSLGFAAVGDQIPYTFTVTNTGQTTLQAISVTDPKASGISCDVTTLASGAIANCVGTHTVSQADLDAGKVVNTASVVGTPPGGAPIPPTSSTPVTVNGTQTPKLTIAKATTAVSYFAVGETIPYTFVVKNEGNLTLTNVAVTDTKTTGVTCVSTALAPGQSTSCSGTRIVTAADLNAGSVNNIASVTAKLPNGTTTTPVDSNQIVVPAVQTPELTITKASTLTSFSTLNATIPYSFTVANTGNVTMTAIAITDPNTAGVTCASTSLNPGVSTLCSGSHTVTQADLDGGSVTNTAKVTGTPPSGTPITPVSSNTVKIPATPAPAIKITKSTTTTTYSTVGATVPYSFLVENKGNVTLSSIVVSDPKLTSVSCVATSLAPGVSTTCNGNHLVTQSDVDSGTIVNVASVTAKTPSGASVPPVSSNKITLTATQNPKLKIVKATAKVDVSAVGEAIPYTFTVTNIGNVTMSDIAVIDPNTSTAVCPQTTLTPGDSIDCTATHTVTQADLDAGKVVNTAEVGGTPPSGTPIAPVPSNPVTVPAIQTPKLTVAKASSSPSFAAVGDAIDYTFKVTNTGNVTMNSIAVTDPVVGTVACPVSTLAPGDSTTCTGSRLATANDVIAGKVVNTATVGAKNPAAVALTPIDSNTVTVPLLPLPAIKIVKTADKSSVSAITDVITYKFVVTNTGNVAISAVSVTDAKATGITCDVTVLAIRDKATCFGTHNVDAADLDAGSVINTAAVDATPASGPAIPTTSSNTIAIPSNQAPKLTIVKETPASTYATVGESIDYTFLVKNEGNVTISSISVADPVAIGITCPSTTLAAGVSTTCTGTHTVTQADLDGGSVINQAKVGGTPPNGAPLAPVDSNIKTVPATQTAGLKISKNTTTQIVAAVGETIPYTFQVTNSGNVSVTDVKVIDPNATGISCSVTSLAPGTGTLCTGTHTVTQADLDTGKIINTASVIATPPSGTPTAPVDSNTITVPAKQLPSLTVSKATTKATYSAVGDQIPFTFLVRNTGNVTIDPITVTDPNATGIACTPSALAPGDQVTCTGAHAVTQNDLDSGSVINTASVSGTPPSGNPIPPVSSNTVAVPATQTPALTIVKATAKPDYSALGELIDYTFVVTNTGNVSITDIAITDPIAGAVSCTPRSLAPAASVTCTAKRAATQDDIDSGAIINSASVTGKSPDGSALAPIGSNVVTVPANQNPTLTLEKSTTTTNYATVGDSVSYAFTVTNRGNVTLANVTVSDPLVSGLTCLANKLAPKASTTCSGSHAVTQADIDAGKITNTAQVAATQPNGTPITPVNSNTVIVPAVQTPKLTIDKSSTTPSFAASGESIDYTFVITNTGNVTMTAVSINDPLVAALSCPTTTLAPGASVTCHGAHQVSQTDMDGGKVVNVASVSATPPSGTPVAPILSTPVTVPAVQKPKLTVQKLSTSTGYSTINETIVYSFTITNSGNVTMTKVALDDPLVSGLSCSTTVLAPGAVATCSAQRIVSAADLDAGKIENTATAVGTPPSGIQIAPVPSNTVVLNAAQTPSLSVVKAAATGSYKLPGDLVFYTFRVLNNGNVTMTNVAINDAKLGTITCTPTALPSGDEAVCSGSHTVTQLDLDGGTVVNTATVSGTPPVGAPAFAPAASNTVIVPAIQSPGLTITKSSTTASVSTVGEVVPYSFLVRNTGNVVVTNIVVTDPQTTAVSCDLSKLVNDRIQLSAGDFMTCTGSHVVTQDDLDRGHIDNTANVDGTDPTNKNVGPLPSNTLSIPAAVHASLKVVKQQVGTLPTKAGDVVKYEFIVTNDGNVTMTLVEVHDGKLYSLSCATSTLAPGDATVCQGLHDVTQAEADAGKVLNTGYVTGKPPVGAPLPPKPSNLVDVPIVPISTMTIAKATTAQPFSKVGDVLPYSFELANTGNLTLTNVGVIDPVVSGLTCLANSLAPGEKTSCTGSHSVTQADIDLGTVVNTASVTAKDPFGNATPRVDSNQVTIPGVRNAGIAIVKGTSTASVAVAGTNIAYTFEVTNTGNVTLSNVKVTDTNVTGMNCPAAPLVPGTTMVCTAIHSVTLFDLNAGSIVNTASVVADPPLGMPALPTLDSNTITVPVVQGPALSIAKVAKVGSFNTVGDRIQFEFTVTNNGNVTMTNIVVADPKTASVVCDLTALAPAAETKCYGTHTVVQADIDAEQVVNTASVTGGTPKGVDIAPVPSNTVIVPAITDPRLSIVKKAVNTVAPASLGELVPYTFTVTNDGNIALTNIIVSDANVAGVQCPVSKLAPTESTICTGSHAVTQADLDAGHIDNTASVTAKTPTGKQLPSISSNPVRVDTTESASVDILKGSASGTFNAIGQAIPYTFIVTNTGNVTVTAVTVKDLLVGSIVCPQTTLAPAEQTTCTGNHVVVQADLDAGAVINIAHVDAMAPSGIKTPLVDSNPVTVPAAQGPSVTLEKSSTTAPVKTVGAPIEYSFKVTNTGNVSLTEVALTDPNVVGLSCPVTSLKPGESTTCIATHSTTQADLDAGKVVNVATVTAKLPNGSKLPSVPSNEVTVSAAQDPQLSIVKSANNAAASRTVGEVIAYEFVVTNTGNVTISNVKVTDAKVTDLSCPKSTLSPTESMTCSASLTVTSADQTAGFVTNTASVIGDDPTGKALPSVLSNEVRIQTRIDVLVAVPPQPMPVTEDTFVISTSLAPNVATPTTVVPGSTVPAPAKGAPKPSIELKKSAPSAFHAVGDQVTYLFTITNTGNTELTDIKLEDAMPGLTKPDCGAFDNTLAAGASVTCSANYSVTEDDITRGSIKNTASVSGVDPAGNRTAKVLGQSTAVTSFESPGTLSLTGAASRTMGALALLLMATGAGLLGMLAAWRRRKA